ncbi:hypothetical protein C8Q79DRAFT_914585 [Trametes meyenii]|nr:hypothetical protein C8Q79DRAFT_914585 [Trametes meyenii]
MTARPTKSKLVSAVRKRLGRELSGDEVLMLARAMRVRQAEPRIYKPRMELWDDGESATITAQFELPGLGPDEVLIDVVDGRLVVSGERRQRPVPVPIPGAGAGVARGRGQTAAGGVSSVPQVQELKYGTFRRALVVPEGCTTTDLEATLEHGMLTVSWPRYPGVSPPAPVQAQVQDGQGANPSAELSDSSAANYIPSSRSASRASY